MNAKHIETLVNIPKGKRLMTSYVLTVCEHWFPIRNSHVLV